MRIVTKLFFITMLVGNIAYADWGFFFADRSYIGISINGAPQDVYSIFNSGVGTYQNTTLGNFTSNTQTLEITFWDIKTFKNGPSDVYASSLFYTIYVNGERPGSPIFTEIGGGFIENLGGGDQKWGKSSTTNINISGLEAGKTYVLEIFIRVSGTSPDEDKFDNNGGSNFIATFTTDSAFPVELTSFIASLLYNNIQLNWTTATEIDNYGFEVQRINNSEQISEEGWEVIAFIEGHGNSNSVKEYSFTDKNINTGIYYYRLKQIDNDGSFKYSDHIEIEVTKPTEFSLAQNFPNPFNPSTAVSYQLAVDSKVILTVLDILGNEIKTLVNEFQSAGNYNINFNAESLTSGIYFYTLRAGKFLETKKMVLMK